MLATVSPQAVHSDGGPQFISEQFRRFAADWGFDHTMSSPYHSQSNGKAESAVKIAKGLLRKAQDPYLALLEWRNTPTTGMTESPAQRLYSRRTRSVVLQAEGLLKPQVVSPEQVLKEKWSKRAKAQQDYNAGATDLPEIAEGEPVYVQDLRKLSAGKWQDGCVLSKISDRSYIVKVGEKILRRNRRYIKLRRVMQGANNIGNKLKTARACERRVGTIPARAATFPGLNCERRGSADKESAADLPVQSDCRPTRTCERRVGATAKGAANLPGLNCERRGRAVEKPAADLPVQGEGSEQIMQDKENDVPVATRCGRKSTSTNTLPRLVNDILNVTPTIKPTEIRKPNIELMCVL